MHFLDCNCRVAPRNAACYGFVTAEGCGLGRDRYGQGGILDSSLSALVQQIFEDTPFFMETK